MEPIFDCVVRSMNHHLPRRTDFRQPFRHPDSFLFVFADNVRAVKTLLNHFPEIIRASSDMIYSSFNHNTVPKAALGATINQPQFVSFSIRAPPHFDLRVFIFYPLRRNAEQVVLFFEATGVYHNRRL
jgi:hypothetical protein